MKKLLHSKRFRSLFLLWGLTAISCLVIFSDFLFGDLLVVFNDAGSDTRQQYIMQYATIVNHLKDGNYSLWDLNNGFGASMFALNMSNVFLMLIYLAACVLGIGHIPGLIVYLLILQIFLAGTLCYLFLDSFSFSERSKVIAAYLYALNGYLLIWGQHYQFGSFVVFLPLLLLLLERAIRRKKFSLSVPFVVAAMVCASVYMSYMALILAGFYIIYRMVLSDDARRQRIRGFFSHCASIVLGIGIGSFIFLPMAYYLMTNSSRLDSSQPFFERLLSYFSLYGSDFYKTAFLRSFSSVAQGVSDYNGYSNFYEAPVLFFSILFLLLAFQYVFTIHRQKTSRKSKCLQYGAVLFFVFCMFVRIGAAAFNAFAYPFARHSFLFMPLFALLSAYTLDQILIRRVLHLPALALSGVYVTAAAILSYRELTEDFLKTYVAVSAVLAWAMIVLLAAAVYGPHILYRRNSKPYSPAGSATDNVKTTRGFWECRRIVAALLLLCVAANVTGEGYYCYNRRNVLRRSDPSYWGSLYNPNVEEALAYIYENDPSLYRIEKDYAAGSYCMDGMAQGYRGISAYNSTPNSNLEEFVNLVIPNFPIMAKYEYTYRQIGYYTGHSTLFGIKYLLSQNSELNMDGFTLLKQFGDIFVYENKNVSSFARFYTDTADSRILNDTYDQYDLETLLLNMLFLDDIPANTQAALSGDTGNDMPEVSSDDSANDMPETSADTATANDLQNVLTDYALEEVPVHIKNINADGSSDSVTIPIDRSALKDYERVYLSFDIKLPEGGEIGINQELPLPYFFRVNKGEKKHVQIALPNDYDHVTFHNLLGPLKGKLSNIRLLGSRAKASEAAQGVVTMDNTTNDSILSGTISAQKDGYLFLPVPYENGWSAVVDGKETEILRADIGFMSIPVNAGAHSFVFTYRQPYMQEGIYVSLLSLAVWTVLFAVRRYQNKRCRK